MSNTIEIQRERSMGIKQSKEAYHILSSQVYSDKIRAVLRELSTNALDSHIQAGNDQPFHVQLPHESNNYEFFIRDFGTGLDEEDLFSVYATYFETTKAQNKKFNGSMGLGSKSPFAYVDSYLITSYYEGTEVVILAEKDDEGIPAFSKLGDSPTEEPNGIKISFTCNPYDVSDFRSKAMVVYSAFPPERAPKLTPDDRQKSLDNLFEYMEENRTVISPELYVLPSDFNGFPSSEKTWVNQGAVWYPVDVDKIFDDRNSLTYRYFDRTSDFKVIKAPNKALSYSASREQLSYTNKTVARIRSLLEKHFETVIDNKKAEVQKAYQENDHITLAKMYRAAQENSLFLSTDDFPRDYVDDRGFKMLCNVIHDMPIFSLNHPEVGYHITNRSYYRRPTGSTFSRIKFDTEYKNIVMVPATYMKGSNFARLLTRFVRSNPEIPCKVYRNDDITLLKDLVDNFYYDKRIIVAEAIPSTSYKRLIEYFKTLSIPGFDEFADEFTASLPKRTSTGGGNSGPRKAEDEIIVGYEALTRQAVKYGDFKNCNVLKSENYSRFVALNVKQFGGIPNRPVVVVDQYQSTLKRFEKYMQHNTLINPFEHKVTTKFFRAKSRFEFYLNRLRDMTESKYQRYWTRKEEEAIHSLEPLIKEHAEYKRAQKLAKLIKRASLSLDGTENKSEVKELSMAVILTVLEAHYPLAKIEYVEESIEYIKLKQEKSNGN